MSEYSWALGSREKRGTGEKRGRIFIVARNCYRRELRDIGRGYSFSLKRKLRGRKGKESSLLMEIFFFSEVVMERERSIFLW